MDNRAIAFFDSGIGGLSCVQAFKERLAGESLVYYGDTLHAPYGDREAAELRDFAERIADFLTEQDIKMLVVACNTISSLHLGALRDRYPALPVVGTVEPTAKYLAENCAGRSIGIIATRATVASGTYPAQLKRQGRTEKVYSLACPDFVPMIEAGVHEGPEAEAVVRRSMDDFVRSTGIDVLVLGCTHFPFIQRTIQRLYPHLELIDPAEIMAAGAESILTESGALAGPGVQFTERYYFSLVTETCCSAVGCVSNAQPMELKLY